ncbi:MAG: FAD-dependent oxidoreductase, partial [Bacteroidales bacterium]|nr:FAD-dependent oxidoreductase [Bacteroidales bacterium]
VGLRGKVLEALKDGLEIPTERTILITGLNEDEIWVNMSRINGVDGTDPASLTYGEKVGRKQIFEIEKYLKQYVPGFENAYMDRVAPFLGIRESRRIVGQYVLTEEDILSRRHFDDSIAVASYPIDIHHPDGGGCTLRWSGDCYDIPYRSLIPLEVENLIVAGRSISTTHEAMSAIRVMAPCMLMGEAAGLAANLAIKHNIYPSQVDAQELREDILAEGGFLREK